VDRTLDSCTGASCHAASNANLTTLHPTLGCDTCHASTVRDAVKTAISTHNKNCSACHGDDQMSIHAAKHSYCGDCHANSGWWAYSDHPYGVTIAQPSSSTCANCHGSPFGVTTVHDSYSDSCGDCHS